MRSLSFLVAVAALAFPAGASAEPSINLDSEVQEPCGYCSSLSGTINGGADAVAWRAASSPYSLAYDWTLQQPCQWPHTATPCPAVVHTGPFQTGWAPWWSEPETLTLLVWAERPVSSCTYSEPQDCKQERCSGAQTVTLPASVTIACSITNATIRPRHQRRHRR
jgi:hypothetical protein